MSLKALHLVLVLAAILAASCYGSWCLLRVARGESGLLGAGLVSLGAGAGLVVYGARFYKQTEKEPWL